MDAKSAKYLDPMRQVVQPHCSEQLVAVGLLRPIGMFAAMFGGHLAKGAEAAAKRDLSGDMNMALCAVTESSIRIFEATWRKKHWEIIGEFAAWPRTGVHITGSKGRATCPMAFDPIDSDEHYEFEAQYIGRANRALTDALFAALLPDTR
jgi:hypothetical protein